MEGFENRLHKHDWYDISFIMKGDFVYQIEGEEYDVSEGDIVVVRPHQMHRETIVDPDKKFESVFVCIDFCTKEEAAEIIQVPPVVRGLNNNYIYSIFENVLLEVTYKKTDFLVKIQALLYSLLVELHRSADQAGKSSRDVMTISRLRKEKAVKEIAGYLEQNFSKKISLEELKNVFYLSPQYISSMFKQYNGVTIIEYLNNVRIKNAKKLLAENRYEINEICNMVGIPDIHYFYRVFKKIQGETPSEYRAKSIK